MKRAIIVIGEGLSRKLLLAAKEKKRIKGGMHAPDDSAFIYALERPSPKLMTYYAITSLLAGPFFLFPLIPLFFKYHTLRYRFSDEGISMSWGILFRREVILNYSRIQDIHLSSNVIERWLGLAKLEVQTASGSSSAEMTIEGLTEFSAIRDFIYTKMRGVKETARRRESVAQAAAGAGAGSSDALVQTLMEVAAELRGIRSLVEQSNHANKLNP